MASVSTLGSVGTGGGVFYKSAGADAQYVTDFKRYGIEVSVYMLF
jgi:hypothetical protein